MCKTRINLGIYDQELLASGTDRVRVSNGSQYPSGIAGETQKLSCVYNEIASASPQKTIETMVRVRAARTVIKCVCELSVAPSHQEKDTLARSQVKYCIACAQN